MSRVRVPLLPVRVRWFIVAGIVLVVGIGSTVPLPAGRPTTFGPWYDEVLHVLAYAVLAFALSYATVDPGNSTARRVGTVLALAVGYGILIEFVQLPLPTRHCSLSDVVADAIGAVAGCVLIACEGRIEYVEWGRPRR